MARFEKNNLYNKKYLYTVYILLNKHDKTFHLNYCSSDQLEETYKKHFKCYYNLTGKWMYEMKKNNFRPCLIICENIFSSKPDVFKHVVVWTKNMIDLGYIPVSKTDLLDYCNDLTEENLLLYENIDTKELKNKIDCKNCFMTSFRNYKCTKGGCENE